MAEDTIVVYDGHGEQHTVPAAAAQWCIEQGSLFLEPPSKPMPHKNPNGPGYKWTEVSADGYSVVDYFGYDPPEHGYLERRTQRTPEPPRPQRIPIRPIADNSGGKFDAKHEVDNLKQTVRQLTDYVNELRRDVDTLQGHEE